MKLHPEEMALARAYTAALDFEGLTDAQTARIMTRGRELFHWFKSHYALHCAISTAVLIFIFAADYWAQVTLPAWLFAGGASPSTLTATAAAVAAGGLHSWLMYSLSVYSMHEGAAHQIVYPPRGPLSRALHAVAANLCRIATSEPRQYSTHHMIHHSKFGSEEDAEFLNFVRAERYWPTFLPLAFDINYTDFIVHRPLGLTRDRLISALWAAPYHGLYAWYAWRHFGALYTIVAYVIMLPHVGFLLDRLRQFTEHNLMPLDNKNGSRSFGYGAWGIVVGGGPWGSPCHWEHHLVPSLPWYQQLILHHDVVRMLSPKQRRQFLIEPVIGLPKLWWSVVKTASRFSADRAPMTRRGTASR